MTATGTKRALFLGLCVFGASLFTALGVWQIERLYWKLDLIRTVNARVHARPTAIPPPASWNRLDGKAIEYRHVELSGTWMPHKQTFVDALTERGAGNWLIAPLRTKSGTILINRGFVPKAWSGGEPTGRVTVTGLVRRSEADGRFLRPNRPVEGHWYSRDVAAIARARGLDQVAPFFIDADASPNSDGYPVGGLTVVHFRNAHLVYAITWFALAGLCIAGLVLLTKPAHKRG